MSRRDTIIIAVLVNAALLMILFATAMRTDHTKDKTNTHSSAGDQRIGELAHQTPHESPTAEDLFNEFVTTAPTQNQNSTQETVLTFEETALAFASPVEEVVETTIKKPTEEIRIEAPKLEDLVVNVTVKKGDFLEKIAKANNTTIAAIMKANNLSSSQLKIGQVLKVPVSEKKMQQHKSSSVAPTNDGEFYVVKEGDNPWLIASRNKINLEELLRINGLDEQKAKRLRPGDKLRIR